MFFPHLARALAAAVFLAGPAGSQDAAELWDRGLRLEAIELLVRAVEAEPANRASRLRSSSTRSREMSDTNCPC